MADLPAVLEVLRTRDDVELQAWGCAALRNLTEESPELHLRALDLGALPLVLHALQLHEAPQVQECGLAALSGFARSSGASALEAMALALRALKEYPQDAEVQRWSLSTLGELLKLENLSEELWRHPFLPLVGGSMQRHAAAPQVQACACALLARLALKSTPQVLEVDRVFRGLILNALEEHGAALEVQACACSALGALALHGQRETLVESRAPHLILEAMRRHPSPILQEKAANALRCLAAAPARARILELGAAEVLLRRPSVASLAALHALCAVPAENFAVVPPRSPEVCGIELLLQCLEEHPDSTTCQESGLALLWGRLTSQEALPKAVAVAQRALTSSAPRVLTYACAVLGRLELPPGELLKAVKAVLKALKAHPESRMLQERGYETLLVLLQQPQEQDVELPWRSLLEAMRKHPGPLQEIGCSIMSLRSLAAPPTRQRLVDLAAQQLIAEAMLSRKTEAMQDAGCAALQCLAMAGAAYAEEPLVAALETQPDSQAVQIRAFDLLSAAARDTTPCLLRAGDLAVEALRRHGQDEALAEAAMRLLLRLVCSSSEAMECIGSLVMDFLGEEGSARTLLRHLARCSHDVASRILALNGLEPLVQAAAPPLLALQLLTRLARAVAWRGALRGSAAARRRILEALQEMQSKVLGPCACMLLSRLAADGADDLEDTIEPLLQQLQACCDAELPEVQAWSFLSLQNLSCGSTAEALRRRVHCTAVLCRCVCSLARTRDCHARLETILVLCLHSVSSVCDVQQLLSLTEDEVLEMLVRALGPSWALEVRERACFLLCFLANCLEKVKDAFVAGGSSLWKAVLEVVKDHLASDAEPGELLLQLELPLDGVMEPCFLRASEVSTPELVLQSMQALSFEARMQVTACGALRRLALASVARGGWSGAPRALGATAQALRQHEQSDEVQRAAVLALQALLRLSCSLEGEEQAVNRVVSLGTLPLLTRALQNYPEDPPLQERGLDALRLLVTWRPDVAAELRPLQMVPSVVEAMNRNISKVKVQEYGLSLLAEVGWQGREEQLEVLSALGVETVVRALKAFPESAEVQTSGLAAVQALTSDNEDCRVKFFSLCEILEIIMQAMGNFPLTEGVQAFGCAALISLAHSKAERVGALADLNCASMAESAMVGHPLSKRVVEFAEQLMQVLKKG